jgi:hypothetical protein
MRRSAFIGILTGFSWLFLACGSTETAGGDPDVEVSADVATDSGFDLGEVVKRECNGASECLDLLGEPDQCEAVICDEADWTCKRLPVEDGALCSDGKLCTQGDACQAGVCVGGEDICECMKDEDCVSAEDGDLCNGTLYCEVSSLPFTCEVDPKTVVSCDDAQDTQCAANACDPLSGECLMTPVEDGTPCDDGETCSEGDQCVQGACVGDDLGCTCHTDADCLAFEDGDLCNGHLYCNDEQLPFKCEQVPGSIIYCGTEQDTDCHKNRCVPGTGNCVMQPVEVGTACEDGNYCTIDDLCVVDEVTALGTCIGGGSRDCSDGNICTNDGCDSATQKCTYEYNNAPCQDNDLCHDGDICLFGFCLGGDEVVTCDDSNGCTLDSCMPLMGCMYEMKSCDDENACTVDFCEPATGECYYEPFVCEDDDPCTQDTCDAPDVGCAFPPKDCGDEDLCTDDACDAETGDCLYATTVCDDGNMCTEDACDSATGCFFTPLADGELCDDGFELTVDDACQGGRCVGTSTEAPGVFRVHTVAVEAPALTYDMGAGPVEINELLGVYITSLIGPDGEGEAIFTLSPFALDYPSPAVSFGRGSCLYEEGLAVACAIDPAADYMDEAPASYGLDEPCLTDPLVDAPCFSAEPVTGATIELGLLDLQAEQAWTAASFTGDPIDGVEGYLMAFVSKAFIDQLVIEDADATFSVQASDALAEVAPELLGETEGYWFRLRLNGEQVTPVEEACDDHNDCTEDVFLFDEGACQSAPVVDGAACDDGFDLTTDDACQAGHCVGTSTEAPTPFRVESVAVEAPILSYDMGEGAVEVNDLLGAYITSRLGPDGDGEAVFTLTPFDLAYPWPTVAFGRGSCLYEEGVAMACAIDPAADFYDEAAARYSLDEACSDEPPVAAPCFAGEPISDAALTLSLLNLQALEAWTVASFTGDPIDGIDGYLMAFVTKAWIDQLVISDEASTFSFVAADALTGVAPELLNEVEGYWFRLRLNGRQVLPMMKACDDGNACTDDGYAFADGACVSTPVVDGAPCDDGFDSTTGDACVAGVCVGAPAEPPATFRVQDITVEAPIFTYDLGAGEMELNEVMSAFATAQLGPDGEGDAVFTLAPFDLIYPTPTVAFGGGVCTYIDGVAISCALDPDADYFGEATATYQETEACALDPLVEAPCYAGEPMEDVSMDLSFLTLQAEQAWTVASFSGFGAQGASGYLMAFVSKAYLDELTIANADFDFKAGEALAGVETALLGEVEGYWFRLRFNAERVLPAPEACDDGEPCTADAYDITEGACAHTVLPDGELCDDGLEETAGDQCVAGACVGEIPPPPAGFRLSTLSIDAPPLCLDLAQIGECTDVTALINGLVGAALDDAEAPTDLLGIFDPFVFGAEGATLSFSNASCARSAEGVIESCWLPDGATPATSDELTLSDVDACSDALPAPCYTSAAPSMALDVMDLPFALVGVETSGGFSSELDAIEAGQITGLLPKAYAMQVGWAFGDTVFTLADALANEPIEEQGGITGWTLQLSYSALRVPLSEPPAP